MALSGKSIVITGAGGISSACARAAAVRGARIFVVAKDPDECASLLAQLEGDGHGSAVADLTSEDDAVEAFDRARRALGRIDGLAAIAGGSGRSMGDGPVDAIGSLSWDKTMALNVTTTFLAAREAARAMIDHHSESRSPGSIVLMSSILAIAPDGVHFATHAYAASKGAIIALGKAMAGYYAPRGVRVNVVAPALVKTPMAARAAADEATASFASWKQPLSGGLINPVGVAETTLFLLSDLARDVTGQVIGVDGGWSVTSAPPSSRAPGEE